MKYSFKSHKTRVHTVYFEFDTIDINKGENKMYSNSEYLRAFPTPRLILFIVCHNMEIKLHLYIVYFDEVIS